MKINKTVSIILLMIIISVVSVFANGSMTRTGPSSASPGSTFQITYSVSGVSGNWGASVIDDVSGGCKFADGTTEQKFVLTSPITSAPVNVIAGSSGSCVFTGNYKFGTDAIIPLNSLSVSVGGGSSVTTPGQVTVTNPPYTNPTTPDVTNPVTTPNTTVYPACTNFWEDPAHNCTAYWVVYPWLVFVGAIFAGLVLLNYIK